ncbi:uncharacterized protein LOC130508513 [Raphanus sativus]|uniref:Uncharacterized protein LOC130508513 n=1 Tax=Raphanus sativus TaxID=3726 RepID=A0A9W3D8L3_RAPSA|nr:uncharacterized protein LOC130508513 [Raphanus sativus]
MGLNENFANIRGQILNMKPRPSLAEIYNMLDQDESQRIVGSTQRVTNPAAFQLQDSLTTDNNPVLLSQRSYQKVKCSYCSRLGHTVDKCYKKHGYPPRMFKGRKPNTVASTNMAITQSVNTQDNGQHEEVSCDQFSKEQLQSMILYLSTQLHSPTSTSTTEKAIASTSASAPVISQITGSLSGNFISLYNHSYHDMLISSASKETYVSLRAWIIDSGATHHVSHDRNMFTDYKPLDQTYVTLPNGYTDLTQALMIGQDSQTWHRRLGHPSIAKVETLYPLLNVPHSKMNKDHSGVCHACHLAKQKRIPFKLRENMSSNAFDLLHIDTWGPFAETCVDGSRYFLTIVDDYSRATWIFLMRAKSDVLDIFPDFVKMVATQYKVNVKTVRSDNANELRFTEFYAARDYLPRTSSKNRHKFDPRARACVFLRHVFFHENIFPFASPYLHDDVKTFFPLVSSPAVPDVVFSEPTSSDAHSHQNVSSSKDLLPSGSLPIRTKKQPANLQDFHCYNLDSSTPSSSSTPYPMTKYIFLYFLI